MRAAGADALTPLKSANEYLPVSVPNTFVVSPGFRRVWKLREGRSGQIIWPRALVWLGRSRTRWCWQRHWLGRSHCLRSSSLYLVEFGISECGATGLTAAPKLPNIQALKPPTRKKIMSATVATAKLRSARCDGSGRPPRCL